jgi:O-acetyl-ADP-ribose deacetylase (regulator of RNase III)
VDGNLVLNVAAKGHIVTVRRAHRIMRILKGDLLKLAIEGRFDAIVHGANCQCVMGAGIAKAIRETFPEAYEADLATPKGARTKLGTISCGEVRRGGRLLWVDNAYTQFHYRGIGVRVDYDAVRSALRLVKQRFGGRRIGYPKIGAGLARGDWTVLARIIEEELEGEDHAVVEYEPA